MSDKDEPGTRHAAKGHRVLRSLDDPNEVFVLIEFASPDAANAAREKLLAAGVLDRFSDKTLPKSSKTPRPSPTKRYCRRRQRHPGEEPAGEWRVESEKSRRTCSCSPGVLAAGARHGECGESEGERPVASRKRCR